MPIQSRTMSSSCYAELPSSATQYLLMLPRRIGEYIVRGNRIIMQHYTWLDKIRDAMINLLVVVVGVLFFASQIALLNWLYR